MKQLENRKWEILDSEYLAKEGDWFTVRRERVQLPNGHIIPHWYVFEFPHWVNIIAITKDGQFVLIDQYRHAIRETHYELCAGVVDPTDESPMHAAQRELLEETGFGGGEWEAFMQIRPNPTNQINMQYTFLAKNVEYVGKLGSDPSEDICTHLMTEEEVYELLTSGGIVQALHQAPLWKYFALKKEK